jgi:hypothetical protein
MYSRVVLPAVAVVVLLPVVLAAGITYAVGAPIGVCTAE